MKSEVLPSFWTEYYKIGSELRQQIRKAYQLWSENPFHPSLHFKCINNQEDIWSVRVTRGYRALGFKDADTITWFWIGSHDDYERFFG